ncbi:MAG: alanine--tRNA ligase, partial [Thermodesulfobacteriota bacterium]
DPEKLWITVYKDDDEAAGIWADKIGVPPERIARLDEADNFWAMGETGPCGPCSEVHIDQGPDFGCEKKSCSIECDCGRYLEIWNLVFMQYNRDSEGKLTPLSKPSIDTGMGLERLSAVMQGKKSNYETDLFVPIIEFTEKLSKTKNASSVESDISIKAIADHARAVTFLITDGILPSNEGRGYVLRRILRRAVRHGKFLGLDSPFLHKVCDKVISLMGKPYPEIVRARDLVLKATKGEEERFFDTLDKGLEILAEEVKKIGKNSTVLSGKAAFKLYDTYGFPLDLTADIIKDKGLKIDEAGFEKAMEAQRTMARSAWKGSGELGADITYKELVKDGIKSEFIGYHTEATSAKVIALLQDGESVEDATGSPLEVITDKTPFYGESGGQVGDTGQIIAKKGSLEIEVTDTKRPLTELIIHIGEIKTGSIKVGDSVELVPNLDKRRATMRNHSATHILHALLRKTLGTHVRQAGSLVGPDGLRFDFNHFEALSAEDIKTIEDEANRATMANIELVTEELSYDEAIKKGALAFFEEKYGDKVRMVQIDGVSTELCGGTHVLRTGDIGPVKITGESSVAAGVRRIEAVTGEAAIKLAVETDTTLKRIAGLLKSGPHEIPERIDKLIKENKKLTREIDKIKSKGKEDALGDLKDHIKIIDNINTLCIRTDSDNPKEMRAISDKARIQIKSGITMVSSTADGNVKLLVTVTKDLTDRFNAGKIIKEVAPIIGGSGGGKPDMAQAGGDKPKKIEEAEKEFIKIIEESGSK